MKTCTLSDFMQSLNPWLNEDYVRSVVVDANHRLRLHFVDGGEAVYRIDDCTEDRLEEILDRLKNNGIPVQELGDKH